MSFFMKGPEQIGRDIRATRERNIARISSEKRIRPVPSPNKRCGSFKLNQPAATTRIGKQAPRKAMAPGAAALVFKQRSPNSFAIVII
jgi:hypothetical protein